MAWRDIELLDCGENFSNADRAVEQGLRDDTAHDIKDLRHAGRVRGHLAKRQKERHQSQLPGHP